MGITMAVTEKAILTWSGGKDSALALYDLQVNNTYKVSVLLTNMTEGYDRISMHGVQSVLLERQGESLGLPVEKIYLTRHASNDEYEAKMRETLMCYRRRGILSVVFGDIFLEDVRRYREENLLRVEMKAVFPLWKRDTTKLARRFIDLGFKAVITCVDSRALDKTFVGRGFDDMFLSQLPPDVDPCGENGEFHSFVYNGPIFRERILYKKGEVVLQDNRFYYCDLLPL
jgi:uncharacterized protein (TIGR00290 family)